MIFSEPSGSRARTRSKMKSMYAEARGSVHAELNKPVCSPLASYVNPSRINAYSVNDESRIHDALYQVPAQTFPLNTRIS